MTESGSRNGAESILFVIQCLFASESVVVPGANSGQRFGSAKGVGGLVPVGLWSLRKFIGGR